MTLLQHEPALLVAALEAADEAVVLCRRDDDTILLVNAAAAALLPGLVPGGRAPVAVDFFNTEHDGRFLHGRRRQLGPDHYGWFLRDDTDAMTRAGEQARITFLAEAGRRLSATLHQGRCLRTTVELAVSQLADAAMVVLPVDRGQTLWVRLSSGGRVEEGTLREAALPDMPGLVEALGGFPPIPSRWLDAAQAPPWLLPDGFGPIGSLLVVPLPGHAEPAGALILVRRGRFASDDEVLARIFAARAGSAIAAAGLYRAQAETAGILQADLLPPELPRIDGIELAGSYQVARDALQIGGDFYDVFGPTATSDDTVIVLGDVCGKGPEAAVLTGKVRQTLRALRLMEATPETMLRVLNQALLQSTRQHRFVTMVVGSVHRTAGGGVRIALATGGHPAPLVLRADGTVEEAAISGTLIGAVQNTVVRPGAVELAPGELCLLYSDGVTEAQGGPSGQDEFGEARLRAILSSCAGGPAAATVERIRQVVSDWVRGGTHDDIAMLAVRARTSS